MSHEYHVYDFDKTLTNYILTTESVESGEYLKTNLFRKLVAENFSKYISNCINSAMSLFPAINSCSVITHPPIKNN